MADPFVAEIRVFPFAFAPTGWAFCDGQILPISQNTALFSLLGTTYGGDGKSTFELPNLQGRVPMHPGQGPGLSLHDLGELSGSDTVSLLQSEIPAHNHNVLSNNLNTGQTGVAAGDAPGKAVLSGAAQSIYATGSADTQFHPQVINTAGSNQPHNNDMLSLGLNFCIALQGVFPPRT
jgi:microcystin-dependent protein